MNYQRIILDTMTIDGNPGLPESLVGLDDTSLSNLELVLIPCPEEYQGIGYLSIQEADPLPAHKISLGLSVQMVDDQPKWIHELGDAPRPDPVLVQAEALRRIQEGSTFTVSGYGDVSLSGDKETQIYLLWLKDAAQALDALGTTDPIMQLRGSDAVMHSLTPQQMLDVIGQGAAWINALKIVAWSMIDNTTPFETGVPYDYMENHYWN